MDAPDVDESEPQVRLERSMRLEEGSLPEDRLARLVRKVFQGVELPKASCTSSLLHKLTVLPLETRCSLLNYPGMEPCDHLLQ